MKRLATVWLLSIYYNKSTQKLKKNLMLHFFYLPPPYKKKSGYDTELYTDKLKGNFIREPIQTDDAMLAFSD
jgi:hypothetical protein